MCARLKKISCTNCTNINPSSSSTRPVLKLILTHWKSLIYNELWEIANRYNSFKTDEKLTIEYMRHRHALLS